jgi:Family of unknown function (DUF6088)
MATLTYKMIGRILNKGHSWVFSAHDFLDLGRRQTVNQNLSRLAGEKFIRRLAHGLYDHPEYSYLLKKFPDPSPDEIADALARKTRTRSELCVVGGQIVTEVPDPSILSKTKPE